MVNGFRVTWLAQLDRARLAKEQAEEYGFDVNFTSNTRLNVDTPIAKKAAVDEKPFNIVEVSFRLGMLGVWELQPYGGYLSISIERVFQLVPL